MFEQKFKYQKIDYSKILLSILMVILIATASFQIGKNSNKSVTKDSGLIIEKGSEDNNIDKKTESETAKMSILSKALERKQIIVPENAQVIDTESTEKNGNNECVFVASKNSKKYHRANCSTAEKIKEANRICFISEEDAESEGYTAAADCAKK